MKLAPHPRLRALLDVMPRQKIALPWVAPSRPWWPLEGPWAATDADNVDGKLLVFSRYRATPAVVAGLVSYGIEASRRAGGKGATTAWEAVSKRSLLTASPERPGLLALFHPSPLLASLDPLRARGSGTLELRRSMLSQLIARLADLGVKVVTRGPREKHFAPWQMIAALEQRAGLWDRSRAAWRSVVDAVKDERHEPAAGSRLETMIDRWHEVRTEDVSVLDPGEAWLLADFAMEAPGIVLGRTLMLPLVSPVRPRAEPISAYT